MTKRITALLLAALMLVTALPGLIYADDTPAVIVDPNDQTIILATQEFTVNYYKESFDEIYSKYINHRTDNEDPMISYLSEKFNLDSEKMATMVKVYTDEARHIELYYEYYTGEVVIKNTLTGQLLFTNPYDVTSDFSTKANSQETKYELLSQILLEYEDNGTTRKFNSYRDAAVKKQIRMKPIKGGIRVEYTLGDESTTYLVPRMMEKSRFESLIYNKVLSYGTTASQTIAKKLSGEGFYLLYDLSDPKWSEGMRQTLLEKWPVLEKMAVYIFDESDEMTKTDYLRKAERYIKTYCPEYSYDDLEYDHELTGYTGNDKAPPNFKMALEYIVTDDGVDVRLPANGIRFDESVYKLTSVSVLPYLGAGHDRYTGYTFIPDGSGALIRFEDITNIYNISGEMYGSDYSYHEILGQHAEVMRYPVYGVVTNKRVAADGTVDASKPLEGFVAIITEGDSMAKILSTHGGTTHNYNSVYPIFNPRPTDKYSLTSSSYTTASAEGATWTVSSNRRYTGSYRIKLVMLTEKERAEAAGLTKSYEPTYVGMAKAYQDYLVGNGTLKALTASDVEKDMPLYIESFGSMETDDRFLSVPIKVDTALTTFDDVKTMYDEFAEAGINNVNFRLTGFANGGLEATVPYKLKWMDVLGGSEGFESLIAYAKEKGFGLYPNFDFTYMNKSETFDGFSLKKHAVRTMDGRYTSKRYYDAATQQWQNDFAIAISPASYSYLYGGLSERLDKYDLAGISVGTLGTDLNSDFDEDDPYNREDSKALTRDLLAQISDRYDVMLDGGNAYTFDYADVILGMSMESSKYTRSSESVPFIGIVLHGYVVTTGNAFNMEGDIKTAFLHAIENGSALYFILSYRNTELLKESVSYSKYYSVRYEVWKEEVIRYYSELNKAIGDLQTVTIVDHRSITAHRVKDADEAAADEQAVQDFIADAEAQAQIDQQKAERRAALEERRAAAAQNVPDDTDTENPDDQAETPDDTDTENTDDAAADDQQTDDNTDANANEGDKTDDTAKDDGKTEVKPVREADVNAKRDELEEKYLTTGGSVILVEYANGVKFIINFNSFKISAELDDGTTVEVDALGYKRIEA